MGVVTSNDMAKIKAEMARHREQIDNHNGEIEDMQGEVMTLEEQIEELESELKDMEKQALEMGEVFETYFDVLVTGLNSGFDYAIERDPWIMEKRWGIEDTSFCCVIHATKAVYKCSDHVPDKDSVMTLAYMGDDKWTTGT